MSPTGASSPGQSTCLGTFKFFGIVLAMVFFAGTSFSWAQTSGASRYAPSENGWSSKTTVHGSVQAESAQYPTSISENKNLDQSLLTEVDLDIKTSGRWGRARADFSAGRYLNLNNSFFIVREFYGGRSFHKENLSFALGRKIEDWSDLDSHWQLGLWEPKANLDGLRPVSQGLSGLFSKVKNGDFEILAFASPLFVPTMNPDIVEKNGALVSESRWYKTPASFGDVLARKTQLYYSLNLPEIAKLVNNQGAALRVNYRGTEPGFWGRVAAARKPVNMLQIKYDYNLALKSSGSQAQVAVVPVVAYERLVSADLGWNFKKARFSASFLSSDPEAVAPVNDHNELGESTTDWIRQNPGRLNVAALHAKTDFKIPWIGDPIDLQTDYLRADQQESRDYDEKNVDRGSLLPYRLNFTNAAQVKALISGYLRGRQLVSQVTFLRDFDQRGSVWSYSAQYYPAKSWMLTAGFDLLGTDDDSLANTDQRFLNQFRANDRYYGGVSYVF